MSPRRFLPALTPGHRLAAVVLAITVLALVPAAQAARRVLAVDDLFALARVREARISPDGERVAYTVSTSDFDQDRTETALWLVPTAAHGNGAHGNGGAWRATAPGYSASHPRWSPDGRRLAFLAAKKTGDQSAQTEVWAFDLRGGDAQPLTAVPQGVDSFEWSPDGSRLLLTITDAKPEDLLDEAERARKKPEPYVIDRLQFKFDNAGYLDRRRSHLYIFDLESQELRQITSGDFDDSQASFSPDGTLVVFSSNRTAEPDGNDNSDLWIVSAASTDQGQTLRRLTQNPGPDTMPVWSPDGKHIAYLTSIEPELLWYATTYLATLDVDRGAPRILTRKLDRNVSAPRFSPDGSVVFFTLEDSGARHLARIDTRGGAITRPVAGERVVAGTSISHDGRIAVVASEPHQPWDVFLAESGALRRLTDTNRALLDTLDLGAVRNIHFPSADGTEIEGFLTLPPGYDAHLRYPTLLRIHGGPTAQYDFGFDFESQLFAAHGYVVVRANPRGSTGYGQDFSKAIFADWGNKDYQDVMAAVDFAIQEGYADPARLGVGGWSYGGILTDHVITKTDRFAAAITGASEVLYVANYGHDHYQLQWEQELGLPWENRQNWERISPFNQVQKIVTPTLIMGGEIDWNVPIQNSEQLYQALKRLGRTTQLVVYPGEHHGLRRLPFQKDRLERYLAWYDRYVKGETPSTTADAVANEATTHSSG